MFKPDVWSSRDMRNRFDRLFAGTVLALVVAAPALTHARPRAEAVVPLPCSFHDHRAAPREATPRPLPMPARKSAPQAAAPARHPAAAAPAPRAAQTGFGNKGVPDKPLDVSDAAIGERLRAIVTAKSFDMRIERAPERRAIAAFYAARNDAPLWTHNGHVTARAQAVIARLKDAAAEGLVAADYPVPDFARLSSAEALANADIEFTDSVLTFVRHLQTGRIAPHRVFAQVLYPEHAPDAAAALKKIAETANVDAALNSFDPPHQGFRALKEKLAALRATVSAAEPPDRIPSGRTIRPGGKDARIPALRARLHVRGKADSTYYDRALYHAVRALQDRHGIKPTGIIDARIIALVNGPTPAHVIATVEANMERWRWLPRDLGDTYVMVNIPDFTLKVVHDHREVWRTKIVVGKPQTPTPLLTASMDSVIINPSWHVPQSIIKNELLPAYRSDPNIFNRLGLEVRKGPGGHITVVQPPGARNALGRIKFDFPNKFQVYLHDTPEKSLFKYDRRAFSHGCMRVQDPTMFGQVILHLAMNGRAPDSRQISLLFGREQRDFRLQRQPLVQLTYQTAFVDDKGKLELRDDIYGFDARINAIMHSNEGHIAGVALPPDPKRDLATVQSNQAILRRVERREALNPIRFFEKAFR
jgi:L,D-transpeptidase YcbB